MMPNQRWNAYVCPACRLVFKFPDNSGNQGAICPACQKILQIPDHKSATIPPIPKTGETPEAPKKIRKRRQGHQTKTTFSWEQEGTPQPIRKKQSKGKLPTLIIFLTVLLCGMAAWYFWAEQRTQLSSNETTITIDAQSISPPEPPKEAPSTSGTNTEFLEKNATLLTEAEELARKFLSAQTVEELRELIRNPDVNIPRIMKLHPDGKIDMGGLSTFNAEEQIIHEGKFTAFVVRTKNFDERTMVFAETSEGIRIDWESWEGWCEMGWEEFMATKPTTGTLFRVKLNNTNYYNFDFSDESKWRSHTLLSADDKHRMYGYVELGSLIEDDIPAFTEETDRFFILSLKFPENSQSNNQVIIERVIASGWIAPDPPPP